METERRNPTDDSATATFGPRGAAAPGAGPSLLRRWLTRPTDPLPLVVFRAAFGALMLFSAIRFLAKGWVGTQYIQPDFRFRYLFFEWIQPLPGDWLYLVFAAQIVCAALISLGWHYRIAALGFFLAFTYVELLDQTTYLNHYYFVSLVSFLLIFLPLNRWGSIDARRTDAGTEGNRGRGAARWIPLVLQLQIALVYFFAGVAKLNPDWLFEAQPLRIWLAARSGFPLLGAFFDQEWFAYAMSWAGAAFDLTIPLLLFWRRSRPFAYAAVVGFHVATGMLFPIGVFPWVMMGATLVFFEGRELRRAAEWLGETFRARSLGTLVGRGSPSGSAAGPGLATGVLLAVFFVLQVALPIRHLAYPGPVLWTGEGYRFSWRVMLAEKTGTVFYHLRDPVSGRSWEVIPGDHLTPMQEKQFAFEPDMILEFAHHLRDAHRTETGVTPEVRAQAFVSLNGRPSRLLVNPEVDLARVPRGLGRKAWILPPDQAHRLETAQADYADSSDARASSVLESISCPPGCTTTR